MRRLLILSFSPIARDPRVMRQCRLAVAEGYDLTVIGYGTPNDPVPGRFIPLPAPTPGLRRRLATLAVQGPSLLCGCAARLGYWSIPGHRQALREALAARPDFVHANDWPSLPIAAALKAPFLYDSHEYAVGEQEERLLWRLVFQPYIRAIEQRHIAQAKTIVTVSDGVARRIQETYGLAQAPAVIRNMPDYVETAFRPTGPVIEILYQGAYNPDRGLENLIASVAAWAPGRRLALRGIGNPAYIRSLEDRVVELGLQERIRFLPPVPPADLIAKAAEFDVGIHPIPPATTQTEYCLPNKFFEYVMAGLCLCVSPAKEMAALVEAHDLGSVMADCSPGKIAEAVNALDAERIDRHKANALRTAATLNWQNEQHKLLGLYRQMA